MSRRDNERRGSSGGRRPHALAAGLLLLIGGAAGAAAQEGTPPGDPTGSPVAIASPAARSVDCTAPLGLAPGNACVLVVHAAAGAPNVDASIDGETAAEGITFGSASPFVAVAPGAHQVRVGPADAESDAATLDLALTFEAGLAYEVVVLTQDDGVTAAILSTNLDPLADDRARVRVFQAIPGAPSAEVARAGGETVIPDIEYGSATGYAEVPAGETPIDLEIRASGLPIAFPIEGAALEPGTVTTFYALGDVTDPASLAVLPVSAPASGATAAGTQAPAIDPIPLTPGTPAAGTPAAASA